MEGAFQFSGSAAAVTGAASGIGRALALELAARGCDLALADLNEAGLQGLAEQIRATGRSVFAQKLDVADSAAVHEFAAASTSRLPRLNILINNAGVALLGDFEEIDVAQMHWLMNINFWGVVHGTHAFLPQLKRQPVAHIANISSIFGVIAPPGQCAYAAAKFAVRGFSEALRHELKQNNSVVRLSVVHPGGIDTAIARSARHGSALREAVDVEEVGERFKELAKTTPQQAALRIIRGIEHNEPRILIGNDARFLDFIQRLRPARYWSLLARTMQRMSRKESPAAGTGLASAGKR
jgi:short-subunit dehydrogenase